jgi:hypothetical protein
VARASAQCHLVLLADPCNQLKAEAVTDMTVEVNTFGTGRHQLLEAFSRYIEESIKGAVAKFQLQEGSIGKIRGGG